MEDNFSQIVNFLPDQGDAYFFGFDGSIYEKVKVLLSQHQKRRIHIFNEHVINNNSNRIVTHVGSSRFHGDGVDQPIAFMHVCDGEGQAYIQNAYHNVLPNGICGVTLPYSNLINRGPEAVVHCVQSEIWWRKRPNVAFVSMSNRKLLRELSWPIIRAYCEKHGYDSLFEDDVLDRTRHPSWSKIILLEKIIKENYGKYDLVTWMDDDMIITNMNICLENQLGSDFLSSLTHIFAVSQDLHITNEVFNCGLIVVKCNPSTVPLLQQIWNNCTDRIRWHNLWEQSAACDMYLKHESVRNQIFVAPGRKLQSFFRPGPEKLTWQMGDFIAHVTVNASPEERAVRMKFLLDTMQSIKVFSPVDSVSKTKIQVFEDRIAMVKHFLNSGMDVAELGVFEGKFSDILKNLFTFKSLHLVDVFSGQMGSGDVDGNNFKFVDLDSCFLTLKKKYENEASVYIHKKFSYEFLDSLPNDSLDAIYIDADHSYQGCKTDLTRSFYKIRHGGYIMGHDYKMNMAKATKMYHFGVQQAVDEFCKEFNQTICAFAMDGCVSYCIRVDKTRSQVQSSHTGAGAGVKRPIAILL